MPRELQPCGTPAAFQQHRKRDEEPCKECRHAHNEYARAHKAGKHKGLYAGLPRSAPDDAHRAPCFGDTTGTWDPQGEHEPLAQARVRWRRAARLCRQCPVLDHCAQSAQMAGGDGVWAGLMPDQRTRTTAAGVNEKGPL